MKKSRTFALDSLGNRQFYGNKSKLLRSAVRTACAARNLISLKTDFTQGWVGEMKEMSLMGCISMYVHTYILNLNTFSCVSISTFHPLMFSNHRKMLLSVVQTLKKPLRFWTFQEFSSRLSPCGWVSWIDIFGRVEGTIMQRFKCLLR